MNDKAPANSNHIEQISYGLIAEFDNVDAVVCAARTVRNTGYTRFDVHSPFPIHGIDHVMGIRPTILPWFVLAAGVVGMIGGLMLTGITMSTYIDLPILPESLRGYRYLVSGKPFNSLPAWIPVVFECTILMASLAAVFGMLLLNKLPMLHHPLFTSNKFRRATSDRFFISIESKDDQFDIDKTTQLLNQHGALSVEIIRE